MKAPPTSNGVTTNPVEGEKKRINSELWHACAGPLVSIPPVGSLVVYFPQGHSEQVAASMQKEIDSIPNYPSLPSKLICVLHNVTLHADPETDEVYAQMTLQPVNKVGQLSFDSFIQTYNREAILTSEIGLKQNKQPAEFFCKTLTASDTSTHGGFSVPRRAAEKIFPPLDFNMQPPAQELVAKDLHDISWTFRHIYRGQPKRHLLTTGWSVFVSTKRLSSGDSVLFIRDEKSHLLLGIRPANRQQPALSSSVLSSDSMHIGILAAAAHAATNNSPFTIFYNPRASPSEFVVPLAKYNKAMYTQVSLGMRFRMMFETEECGVRRYMGTVTGISDVDPVRWKNSQWRNLQVGWDESAATDRRTRVSIWEIEPVTTPFYICPPPFFRPKFPRQPGTPDDGSEVENAFQRAMPWLNDDLILKDAQSAMFPGLSLVQWMAMQQSSQLMSSATQSPFVSSVMQDGSITEDPTRLLNFQTHPLSVQSSLLASKLSSQSQQSDQFRRLPDHISQQQPQLLQQVSCSPQQQQLLSAAQQKSLYMQQQQYQQQEQLQMHYLHQQQLKPAGIQELSGKHLNQHLNVSDKLVPQPHSVSQLLHPSHPHQQSSQSPCLPSLGSLQPSSLAHNLQAQQASENKLVLQKQQDQLQQLTQVQLEMQLLQKLQQQHALSQITPQLQSQLSQQLSQESHQFAQSLQQEADSSELLSQAKQSHQLQRNDPTNNLKSPILVRSQSTLSGNDAPSSTNFNSSKYHASSMSLKKKDGHVVSQDEGIPSMDNFLQEVQSKPDIKGWHEQIGARESHQLPSQLSLADQLDASSTTSFSLDGIGHDSFSFPPCLDGNVQVDQRNKFLIAENTDVLMPDTLLSRGLDSGKEIQNMISGYGNQKDVETELSTAAISSQSFGMADMSFYPGCSSDAAINENGTVSRGARTNQSHRMRTYAKVQKRGSVGRCIDVNRYKGYDELRHDLACMFGIEGQLDDPFRNEWKLVYVDHEKDILLVGDDPWEEFVSCVQSIKILSAAEVQQLSLDGGLPKIPVQAQACSNSNNGTTWRG